MLNQRRNLRTEEPVGLQKTGERLSPGFARVFPAATVHNTELRNSFVTPNTPWFVIGAVWMGFFAAGVGTGGKKSGR